MKRRQGSLASPNTLIPSANTYFLWCIRLVQGGELGESGNWNLNYRNYVEIWKIKTHWNYPRAYSVTHWQIAHISYLTVGQSFVKIPLRMWISALILKRHYLISVCVLLTKDHKDESFSDITFISSGIFVVYCGRKWHISLKPNLHTQERIRQQFINLQFLWQF